MGVPNLSRLVIIVTVVWAVVAGFDVDRGEADTLSTQWPTWSHDYQRTSRSPVAIGNPNHMQLEWVRKFPGAINYANPSVEGNIVYISANYPLQAFDLATGDSIGTHDSGFLPAPGHRNNATIHDGYVYSMILFTDQLAKLTPDLVQVYPYWWCYEQIIWSPDCWFMEDRCRYDCALVVEIESTTVAFVLTEPTGSPGLPGQIYAFDATHNDLYDGWATNPIWLDKGARHGPTWDGENLYFGTADNDLTDGTLWSVRAADGVVNWNIELDPAMGFPGGVSYEGGYLYCTALGGENERHYKIDVSGPAPSIVWDHLQPYSIYSYAPPFLYAAPTIGDNDVYVPLANDPGVLVVDKHTGTTVYNFANDGVDLVSLPVTLSADGYLFAGDLQAKWWCLNTNTQSAEFYRQFPLPGPGPVYGTALAEHTVTGERYAVVSIRLGSHIGGLLAAYRLDVGPRPRLVQHEFATALNVPFNATASESHTMSAVFENIGDEPLHFTDVQIVSTVANEASPTSWSENLPDKFDRGRSRAEVNTEFPFAEPSIEAATKYQSLQGNVPTSAAITSSRTFDVRINGVLAEGATLQPGETGELSWQFDGSGMGRDVVKETIILECDDPDFDYFNLDEGISHTGFDITYTGGCADASVELVWNTLGDTNKSRVYNNGALGDFLNKEDLLWGSEPFHGNDIIYDGSFVILGDSSEELSSVVELRMDIYDYGMGCDRFNAEPNPTGDCDFEGVQYVQMGFKRTNGCPGTPEPINGAWVRSYFSDTNSNVPPGERASTMNIDVIHTQVGAHDPMYGDFKLMRWEMANNGTVDHPSIYAGTQLDVDLPLSVYELGIISEEFDGYVTWDNTQPSNAYGVLNPNQPSLQSRVDPVSHKPHNVSLHSVFYELCGQDYCVGRCDASSWESEIKAWDIAINEQWVYYYPDLADILTGFLIDGPFYLAAGDTIAVHQAFFAVDATSNDPDVIEDLASDVAARAARWAGFARGDVNDDGLVDLNDVLWLEAGYPIYPDTYCGDVNLDGIVDTSDIAQLVQWISGDASAQPQGEWRFTF